MTSVDNNDKLSAKLPFDQYSRQRVVSYLIDEAFRKKSGNKSFEIIDIGGYRGKTAEFQPKDSVTILDLFNSKSKNYVKGDATNMSFADDTFDIACSFDVFEHIPRAKRQAFIDESLRVSRLGVFLAIPIDIDGHVSSAEVELNDFYVNLTGYDHKWLREHIDYKIPTYANVESLINKSGAAMTSISSNQIGDWRLMQMLIFMASVIPEIIGDVNNINEWYNNNILSLDSKVDIGYRNIFFISKHKKNTEAVKEVIDKIRESSRQGKLATVNEKTLHEFSKTLSSISRKYAQLDQRYRDTVGKTERELVASSELLREKLKTEKKRSEALSKEIDEIKTSKAWKIVQSIRSTLHHFMGPKSNKG